MRRQTAHSMPLTFEPLPIATPDEVRALREQMGMTQEELAREMGVTEFTVWRWENGKRPITERRPRCCVASRRNGSATPSSSEECAGPYPGQGQASNSIRPTPSFSAIASTAHSPTV